MNEIPKITPDFIISLVIRRRWIILVSLSLSLCVGIAMGIILPKEYEASTLILIEPQRVPQDYVRSIVSSDPGDRINTLSQQIMSRTNLEKIIDDFKLFADPQDVNLYDEDKIRYLTQRIDVRVTRDRRGADAFSISYRGKNPLKVMRVTNALANSFIDANLKIREGQAHGTSVFLDSELEQMRLRLEGVEEKIKVYRKNYMGELPEQLDSNLGTLNRLQASLNARQQSLRQAKIRLSSLQAQSTDRSQQVVIIDSNNRNVVNTGSSLADLRAQLESLKSRYTEKHPDIIRLKKTIKEREAAQESQSAGNDSSVTRTYISPQLRLQITAVKQDINVTETEIENIKRQIQEYQRRVENTPRREQELLSLRRGYQNIQRSYDSLLARKLEADIAVNMERKSKGEQFRIIDPAKVPQKPVSPNMKKIFMMIMVLGIGLGGGVSFLLDFFNTSFRRPDDIEESLDLPVLATLPIIQKPFQKWLSRINQACSIIFLAVTTGLFGVFALICLKGSEPVVEMLKKIM